MYKDTNNVDFNMRKIILISLQTLVSWHIRAQFETLLKSLLKPLWRHM